MHLLFQTDVVNISRRQNITENVGNWLQRIRTHKGQKSKDSNGLANMSERLGRIIHEKIHNQEKFDVVPEDR